MEGAPEDVKSNETAREIHYSQTGIDGALFFCGWSCLGESSHDWDDFNYYADDPSTEFWQSPIQQGHPYGPHDMWVENPYLRAVNYSCGLPHIPNAGCTADAILVSKYSIWYDTAFPDDMLTLTERYSPDVYNRNFCEPFGGFDKIHFASMRYKDLEGSAGARVSLVVVYTCSFTFEVWVEGWKPDDTCCFSSRLFSDIQADEWITMFMQSQNGNTFARVTREGGETRTSETFDSKLTRSSNYVELKLDYIHNEETRTDYSHVLLNGGGGGGSPHLGAFDGQSWVLDNNLMPAAERSNGQDVTDHYLVQKKPLSVNGHYMLRISEFENAHNYVDQVKLLAVDHGEGYSVGVSPSGQILTYTDPMPAVRAWTSNGTDVTHLLRAPDGVYYEQFLADALTINFSNVPVRSSAKLLIRSDPDFCKACQKSWFDVSVLATNGTWLDVADVFPRKAWSNDLIDLSPLLPFLGGRIVVRMGFDNTHGHRIDFTALDTSPQQSTTIIELSLRSAVHSRLGAVATLVTSDDQRYAEIVPGRPLSSLLRPHVRASLKEIS